MPCSELYLIAPRVFTLLVPFDSGCIRHVELWMFWGQSTQNCRGISSFAATLSLSPFSSCELLGFRPEPVVCTVFIRPHHSFAILRCHTQAHAGREHSLATSSPAGSSLELADICIPLYATSWFRVFKLPSYPRGGIPKHGHRNRRVVLHRC